MAQSKAHSHHHGCTSQHNFTLPNSTDFPTQFYHNTILVRVNQTSPNSTLIVGALYILLIYYTQLNALFLNTIS